MKIIIAGSRNFNNYHLLKRKINSIIGKNTNITIISGTANGADKLGERYAEEKKFTIERFPADWDTYGKFAGHRRNEEMAKAGDVLVAFWDGKSRGTINMIDNARKHDLDVHIVNYGNPGKLYLCNINEIKSLDSNVKRMFIARIPIKNMEEYNITWLYRLSPSYDLLQAIKKGQINWGEYVKIYRREMLSMQPVLDRIEDTILTGESIALICYCRNSNRCHRGLLGDYFKEVGINVIESIE